MVLVEKECDSRGAPELVSTGDVGHLPVILLVLSCVGVVYVVDVCECHRDGCRDANAVGHLVVQVPSSLAHQATQRETSTAPNLK